MANTYIEIFTDGSARGNPGPGGYGAILRFNDQLKELSGGFRRTTNNRMELLALIVALENLKTNKLPVRVYSDSKYVIDAITKKWVHGWVKKGFKGKKNRDLWLRYLGLEKQFNLEFVWVKGHNGHPENERCDELAVGAALGSNLETDVFFENEERTQRLLH
jgi:ribonuclease HI